MQVIGPGEKVNPGVGIEVCDIECPTRGPGERLWLIDKPAQYARPAFIRLHEEHAASLLRVRQLLAREFATLELELSFDSSLQRMAQRDCLLAAQGNAGPGDQDIAGVFDERNDLPFGLDRSCIIEIPVLGGFAGGAICQPLPCDGVQPEAVFPGLPVAPAQVRHPDGGGISVGELQCFALLINGGSGGRARAGAAVRESIRGLEFERTTTAFLFIAGDPFPAPSEDRPKLHQPVRRRAQWLTAVLTLVEELFGFVEVAALLAALDIDGLNGSGLVW